MSTTPAAGLTLGGGGGKAAWASASPPAKAVAAANDAASRVLLVLAFFMGFLRGCGIRPGSFRGECVNFRRHVEAMASRAHTDEWD
jgi:hypothetical protein